MRQEIHALQTGANALGFNAGRADGLWGPKTEAGLLALLASHVGRWGDPVEAMHQAVIDLGYLSAGPVSRVWTPELDRGLRAVVEAEGLPRAGAIVEDVTLSPGWGGWVSHEKQVLQGSAGYVVGLFVLHTTATSATWWKGKSNRQMFDEVRGWHLAKGWRDIGYHGLIFPDGEVIEGRGWGEIGAHVIGHNAGSLGYSMVPVNTVTNMGAPEDFYTAETLDAMRGVISKACNATQIRRIAGHNEFANKLCPGFKVDDADWAPLGWAA
ncbi:N-acetylmuramoyl-L-alanine amidase [Alloyangia pacifica]|uniref:N-acetylmuramoyl-L-alanine amidase n=1 Tax=Alloyangia pacifica TaxID=311180 RepID=A0A1I6QKR3_9RHOB|nr:N-acetylmuramoyl-L-alanine amidase [Alloyangia pacifica]SDF91856.1 N-acetylmuramoyl-L-alanine amidase [Alloyangia pacifica]SFS52932.1 N-acetylmuramoyl-L-alanine amidase [Alloyangia pacifica]